MKNSITNAVIAGLGLTLGAFAAGAVELNRFDYQAATGVCQGNSAVYGSNLRFRPLSADNIGTTDQFISCALQGDDSTGRGSSNVTVRVQNAGAGTATINCILVNGFRSNPTTQFATYTNKSAVVAAGGSAFITWVPADITPAPAEINLPQVQCQLPGSTGVLYTYKNYLEDVGA